MRLNLNLLLVTTCMDIGDDMSFNNVIPAKFLEPVYQLNDGKWYVFRWSRQEKREGPFDTEDQAWARYEEMFPEDFGE